MMPEETLAAIKKFESAQCLLLIVMGILFLVPVINKEEWAYVVVALSFFCMGLISIIRGKKYQRDENIFQVTVLGGFLYLILATIIILLTLLGPTLVSIVLGVFVIIYSFSRGFFYQEVVNLRGAWMYNLLYVVIGGILMFVPDERFGLVKRLFGIVVICMGIANYFFIVKQLTKNSQELI